jgi:hypothetical protein
VLGHRPDFPRYARPDVPGEALHALEVSLEHADPVSRKTGAFPGEVRGHSSPVLTIGLMPWL